MGILENERGFFSRILFIDQGFFSRIMIQVMRESEREREMLARE